MADTPAPQPTDDAARRVLATLTRSAVAIAGELDIDKVLQLIVDSARELVGARYAALAVGEWRSGGQANVQRFVFSGLSPEEGRRVPQWPHGRGLLGAVIHGQESIRVDDITADPRSTGFPSGHPTMTTFLGVPIVGAGEAYGNLYLADKIGAASFSDSDEELIRMLAAHAAVAIQNARLYAQLERLAVLEERTRIGMDLHDGVIQSIYAVGLTLESTRLALPAGADEAATLLDSAIGGLNDAIRDIRNFILDLRPRRFAGDVQQGMAQLAREFQANTMVPVSMSMPERFDDLSLPLGRAIFLTTQEALANIARHARAKRVSIGLHLSANRVVLKVQDDGQGFDTQNQNLRLGHGLANMQSRAESLGGVFDIRSAPGAGTTVTLAFPREPQSPASM